VIVLTPLLTGHVIRRMRNGRVHISNGKQRETTIISVNIRPCPKTVLVVAGTVLKTLKVSLRISIVGTLHQLSSRKADAQSVINWTVGGQLS